MHLVWYRRSDDLWNAACTCNATICGVAFDHRATAETAHFALASTERTWRAQNPTRFQDNQIPACGPKLPEPNPNLTGAFVFP